MVYRKKLTIDEHEYTSDKKYIDNLCNRFTLPAFVYEIKDINILNSISPKKLKVDILADEITMKTIVTKLCIRNEVLKNDYLSFHIVVGFTSQKEYTLRI